MRLRGTTLDGFYEQGMGMGGTGVERVYGHIFLFIRGTGLRN
jgi:hypothetical protein